ncbi:hypothetical protein ACKWTF_006655 [Chironomus riparius]
MKLVIVIFLLLGALQAEGIGFLIKSVCPSREKCPQQKAMCPSMQLLDKSLEGCCCKPVCARQNEVYTCGCADKVCNEPQIICIRCMDGCFCKPGYVRDSNNGKCILENQCPQIA